MTQFLRHSVFLRTIASISAVLLVGCSTAPSRIEGDRQLLVWPQLPDLPRFAYETVLRTTADVSGDADAADKLLRTLSGSPDTQHRLLFDKPAAIAARNGSIYVTDGVTKTIVVFDVPRRRTFRFGLRSPGMLAQPSAIALDMSMNVYVADARQRKVLVYDRLGLYLRSVGTASDLERPTGVAVSSDGERIYVIDRADNESNSHRVVVYDKSGQKIKVLGGRGSEAGQFNVPLQGSVAPDGTLYILDAGNFRVQAFDRDGNYLRVFGRLGVTPGTFARPRGIAVDGDGNVYVTDASFNNIQIFNPAGEVLLAVGSGGKNNEPGKYGLLSGVSVDETGRVYVVDQMYNKVEVIRRLSDREGESMLQAAVK